MSYWAHQADLYRVIANVVDEILGGQAADLPIEQPRELCSSSTSRPPKPSA